MGVLPQNTPKVEGRNQYFAYYYYYKDPSNRRRESKIEKMLLVTNGKTVSLKEFKKDNSEKQLLGEYKGTVRDIVNENNTTVSHHFEYRTLTKGGIVDNKRWGTGIVNGNLFDDKKYYFGAFVAQNFEEAILSAGLVIYERVNDEHDFHATNIPEFVRDILIGERIQLSNKDYHKFGFNIEDEIVSDSVLKSMAGNYYVYSQSSSKENPKKIRQFPITIRKTGGIEAHYYDSKGCKITFFGKLKHHSGINGAAHFFESVLRITESGHNDEKDIYAIHYIFDATHIGGNYEFNTLSGLFYYISQSSNIPVVGRAILKRIEMASMIKKKQ